MVWAKLLGILLPHWLRLTATWPDDRCSLFHAARALRDWITALDHHDQLIATVTQIQTHLTHTAKTQSRKKKPATSNSCETPTYSTGPLIPLAAQSKRFPSGAASAQ